MSIGLAHLSPSAAFICPTVPSGRQTSALHLSPTCGGVSVSSPTIAALPFASQTSFMQSSSTALLRGLPTTVAYMHVFTGHVTSSHCVGISQLDGSLLHPSQSPSKQPSLPESPHAVPFGAGPSCFVPPLHASSVQGSLSSTRSVSSGRAAGLPS